VIAQLRLVSIINAKLKSNRHKKLTHLTSVLWIEPAPKMKLLDEASTKIVVV
jgi:hypothetical protein